MTLGFHYNANNTTQHHNNIPQHLPLSLFPLFYTNKS